MHVMTYLPTLPTADYCIEQLETMNIYIYAMCVMMIVVPSITKLI